MVSFIKAGVELAFETMTDTGIKQESAYYESLHETPLIANTIARKVVKYEFIFLKPFTFFTVVYP